MRRRLLFIALAVIMAAVIIGSFTFPDLMLRWIGYNERMLRSVADRVFPYVWIQLGLAALVVLIEILIVGWKQSSLYLLLRPNRSIISDICMFIVSVLQLDYTLIFILTLGLLHKLELGIRTAVNLDQGFIATVIPSPVLQVAFYILLADFMQYLPHYMHHKLSFLWPFHSYHHSATDLNVFTGNRGHPIQSEFTNALITVVPLTLAGVPLVSLLMFRLLRNTLVYMHHSRLPWRWGWFGRYILVSPGYHRIHHSLLPEHYDKNLAVLFPLWDHLFGTYYQGHTPPGETGIPDNPYNKKGFLDDMLVPFRMLKKKG